MKLIAAFVNLAAALTQGHQYAATGDRWTLILAMTGFSLFIVLMTVWFIEHPKPQAKS